MILSKKYVIVGITAPPSVDLIVGQLNFLKQSGFEVALLAPDDSRVRNYCKKEGVRLIPIVIERNISPLKDLITLFKLIHVFRKERPNIINLGTPKISLLGLLAGRITRVPYRIYTCRGFRFEHEVGWLKKLLITLEKVTASCAHKVFCISKSVKDLGVELRIFDDKKSRLINKGSSNGVDLTLFDVVSISVVRKKELLKQLNIENKFVYGFVGRLVDRKGLREMYDAFVEVYNCDSSARLVVVGRPFWDQISDRGVIDRMNTHPGIVMAGFVPLDKVPYYLSLMDVFLLPAHWEGFGNVLIQAAAMGIPIVATEVTGVKDAVSKDYNGILVEKGNHKDLVAAMKNLKNNNSLKLDLGRNGIVWSENFKPELIWQGYVDLYNERF